MKRSYFLVLPVILIAAGLGCQDQKAVNGLEEKKAQAAVEEQKLRDLSLKLLDAERNKDLEATLDFFTEDSVLQPPDAPRFDGLEGVRALLEEMFQLPMEDFESGADRIVVSSESDMAYELGWYRMPFEGPEGRIHEEGKYTIVWRKVDGEWKYLVGCWNNNEPTQS